MPAGKAYVVSSPDLALAVQRNPKALSFWYLEALFGKRLAAISSEAGHKIMTNVHGEEDGPSLFWDGITFLTKVLKPGPGLDAMNRVMVQGISKSLDEIRHVITMATTESTYGPLNPYKDEKVEEAFWHLSNSASSLLVGILPSLFAREGFLGREKVTTAFERYFEAGGYKDGSMMTQGRYRTTLKHGLSPKDIARFEGVQGITILSNTVPSAFWTIYHVFSRPSVLQNIRDEALSLLTVD
ncbi:hypothetical protein MMC15_002349 [Xylographa vitiligo]|nr:hypothetical protein [Xylographa vitiligo]